MTYVIPILHPAAILRGKHGLDPAQPIYLRRAKEILEGAVPDLPTTDAPPKGAVPLPTLYDLELWRQQLDRSRDKTVSVDIESAGWCLLGVGLCRLEDGCPIYLPFRVEEGATYWPTYQKTRQAVKWLYTLLADPEIPKVFHNGQAFDVPYLEEIGFEVEGYVGDTMLMQHVAYPEMPKDLQFISILYCGLPAWKYLVKEEGEGK